jgi:pimeloyl-ACP methyl ester carboxylesterase
VSARARAAAVAARVCCGAVALWLAAVVPLTARAAMSRAYLQRFDASKQLIGLSDGERLAYIDIGPRNAMPLVLLHGYTDSARDWAPIAPFLSGRFRLIIPDLRGQGASSKPDCCYTRFDFAYDIQLLLDRLKLPEAVVVGHSLGSLVAQTFAEEWPGRTRRLILISSTGTYFGPASAGGTVATALPASLAGAATLKDPIDADSAFMKSWWQESMRINPPFFSRRQRKDAAAIPARVWRAIAQQCLLGVDLHFMLPRIEAPTLLIWGGEDTLEGPEGRAALRSGIKGAQVLNFPSLGHDLIWQDPRGVARAMRQFIAGPR